jgi:threonine/homoserine/homoserine lactone efflux protein
LQKNVYAGEVYPQITKNIFSKSFFMPTLLLWFFIFFFTAAVSFAGSLQAGLVNVSVVRTALTRNRQTALWLAAGGSLPEMLYAWLAVLAGNLVLMYPGVFLWADRLAGFVFLGLGILYLRRPSKVVNTGEISSGSAFWQGLGLGLVNPQLFVFWLGVFVYLNTLVMLDSRWLLGAFVAGTAFGAFVLLGGLAYLAHRFRDKLLSETGTARIQKITGGVLILTGFWKTVMLLNF